MHPEITKLLKSQMRMKLEVRKLLKKKLCMKPTRQKASEKERALKAGYKRLETGEKKKDEAQSEEAT